MASFLGQDPSGKLTPKMVVEVPVPATDTAPTPPLVATPSSPVTPVQGYHTVQDSAADRRWQRRRNICMVIDGVDGCLGWIPGLGQMIDVIAVCTCVGFFGPKGFFLLLEMVDITGILGAFVPSCTLLAYACRESA